MSVDLQRQDGVLTRHQTLKTAPVISKGHVTTAGNMMIGLANLNLKRRLREVTHQKQLIANLNDTPFETRILSYVVYQVIAFIDIQKVFPKSK